MGELKRSLSGHRWNMRLVSRAFGDSLDLLFFRRRHEINCSGGARPVKAFRLGFAGVLTRLDHASSPLRCGFPKPLKPGFVANDFVGVQPIKRFSQFLRLTIGRVPM